MTQSTNKNELCLCYSKSNICNFPKRENIVKIDGFSLSKIVFIKIYDMYK